MQSSTDHAAFMQEAIKIAGENPLAPFGSVLVDRRTGTIVASGVNQSSENPTLHGEIAAINDYARQNGRDWNELVLYTTAEPCCMCQGAVLWSGISQVVYGTSIARLKSLGWRQIDISADEVVRRSWNRDLVITADICADDCDRLFREAVAEQG